MTPRLTVSIIIPTYNRASLVCEAVDSLLAQTRAPDQIVVVDDGSTDDTSARLAAYGDRITVERQANAGRSAARNRGIDLSTGDLIGLLDSDDLLAPESIAKRAAFLEANPAFDVVYSGAIMVDAGGTPMRPFRRGAFPSGDVFARLAVNNFFPPHAFLFRREALRDTGPFDTSAEPLEDYDFWLRMAQHHHFAYLPEPLALYRIHGGMTMIEDTEAIARRGANVHARLFHMPAFQRLSRTDRARAYLSQAAKRSGAGQRRAALFYHALALRAAPWYWRGYAVLALELIVGWRRFRPKLR